MTPQFNKVFPLWRPSMFWAPETVVDSAWREHIPFAFWIMDVLRPKKLVELGTHRGASYFAFCQAIERLELDTAAYAIDTWQGDKQAGMYNEDVYRSVLDLNERKYNAFSTLVRSTFDEALPYFSDGGIDLLHIDGLHTYEAVKHDFETWLPLLSDRAIVLFHDTNVRGNDFGVFRLYEELAAQYPSFCFTHGYGLGVIGVGSNPDPAINQFFQCVKDDEVKQNIRQVFFRLGSYCTRMLQIEGLAAELGHARQSINEKDREISSVSSQFDHLSNQIAQLSGLKDERLHDEVEKLKMQFEDVQAWSDALQGQLHEANDRMAALFEKLDAANQTIQAMKARIDAAATESEVARQQNALLEERLTQARSDLSQALDSAVQQREILTAGLSGRIENLERELKRKADIVAESRPRKKSVIGFVNRIYSQARSYVKYGRAPALFDKAWYVAMYDDVRVSGADPWAHFNEHGISERRQPNVLFDTSWYLHRYPDIAANGISPLTHYIKYGSKEGRDPHPFFNAKWYSEINTDVKSKNIDPLLHFLLFGRAEGRLPNPDFNPERYHALRPDVAAHGLTALEHYLHHGLFEGQAWHDPARAAGRETIGFRPSGKGYYMDGSEKAYTYITEHKPADLQEKIGNLAIRVTFSIVVPVYNTPGDLLLRLYESVKSQWYSDWELIFIDDRSTDERVKAQLQEIEKSDERVKLFVTGRNEGISGATNAGLAKAGGDYIVFLDHDDELTDNCLYELAICINETGADFIYSDEDKIDEDGNYVQPFFKPDWSPDTFMSTMYTCHVSCVRRSLASSVGELDSRYDGAQDWDFILRVTEKAEKIAHIPKVLYHWRILANSIASDIGAKPAAVERSKEARLAAIARRGLKGSMMDLEHLPGHSVPVYELPENTSVSIVIPSKNNKAYLSKCVSSIIEKSSFTDYEIIVVDNGSTATETLNYFADISRNPKIRVIPKPIPFNFSALCNFGAAEATGDVIIFLNDDTEVIDADWMQRLAAHSLLPHAGCVGAKLLYGHDGSVQHNGIVNLADGPGHAFIGSPANAPGYFARNVLDGNWLAVTAACLAIERGKFEAVGGFDEDLGVAYNDVELGFRLYEAGFYNVCCASVQLTHHESVSRGIDQLSPEKMKRLLREKEYLYSKHPRFYMHDPFFNTNLHPNDPHFNLKTIWPGER